MGLHLRLPACLTPPPMLTATMPDVLFQKFLFVLTGTVLDVKHPGKHGKVLQTI